MKKNNFSIRINEILHFRERFLGMLVFCLIFIMSVFIPGFLTPHNIKTTLVGLSTDGIVAIGITMVLAVGGIDLSVGSIMALSSVIAGMFVIRLGVSIWVGVIIAIFICLIIGYLISYCVNKIQLNPFITTLSMMSITRGLASIITRGTAVSLGDIEPAFDYIGKGSFLGVPNPVILLLSFGIITDYLMRKSKKFRDIYYVGSNEKAAKLSGINIEQVKVMVYMLSALFACLAGLISLSRFGVSMPNMGISTELRTIAGAVIGGASLTGGKGTIFGTLLGILLLALVNNALILLNISIYWLMFITGLVLLVAVILDKKINK